MAHTSALKNSATKTSNETHARLVLEPESSSDKAVRRLWTAMYHSANSLVIILRPLCQIKTPKTAQHLRRSGHSEQATPPGPSTLEIEARNIRKAGDCSNVRLALHPQSRKRSETVRASSERHRETKRGDETYIN